MYTAQRPFKRSEKLGDPDRVKMCSHMEHHVLKILTNSSRRLPTVGAKIEPGDANILARTKNLWLRRWDVSKCEMNSVIESSVLAPTPSEKSGSPELWTA